jgi:hypothetical protein
MQEQAIEGLTGCEAALNGVGANRAPSVGGEQHFQTRLFREVLERSLCETGRYVERAQRLRPEGELWQTQPDQTREKMAKVVAPVVGREGANNRHNQ